MSAPGYLWPSGASARAVAPLGWALTAAALLAVLAVALLLVAALRHRAPEARPGSDPPELGLGWIYRGVAVSTLVLIGAFAFTLLTLSATGSPPSPPAFTLRVTGHQWWWEIEYLDGSPDHAFATANEIHLPVGRPVKLELVSADVIHSFWVPQLAGKTDLIPGQTNEDWIQADEPGVFLGLCGEFCGLQHAHMHLSVVAETPGEFRAWWARQLRAPTPPPEHADTLGQGVFQVHCAVCHTVRGTEALGRVGPDLSHLMSRRTLAAGLLPNTRGDRAGWVLDAPRLKPGAHMPAIGLPADELQSLLGYLETLD